MTQAVERFAKAQVVIHWLTLLLLIGSFVSHDAMKAAWRFVQRNPGAEFSPELGVRVHTILGVTILVLTLVRLVLRFTKGAPAPVAGQHPVITIASASVHGLLYLMLLAIPLTGMAAWVGGFTEMGDVHEVLFTVGLALVIAHIAAALFHQFVIKDNLLARMRLRG
ncbi:MAG: cytochrome b/b6 domain-containing protein [Rhodobacteraceae bacterium]|jgi:cytochrome b561|nr:cytochrome b/b6 domain-containing protein [Paracoccaceae bacterium]